MKKNMAVFIVSVFVVFCAWSTCVAGVAKVAVLPFSINSAQNMDFLKNGIQDMLSSRLSWEGKVRVIDKENVNRVVQSVTEFQGRNKALLIGAKLAADYVIYGSLTIIGDKTSIDAKVIDVAGQNEPTMIIKQTETIGQVIPEINSFATEINTKVFKRPTVAAQFGKNPEPAQKEQVVSAPNQSFISSNQVVYNTPQAGGGGSSFWKSRNIDHMIVGMDYGDVNNDGNIDLVWVSTHGVHLAQIINGRLAKIEQIYENRINKFVGVDVGDMNGNGTPEIFVSSLVADNDRVSSFVLEFNGSGYKEILDRSPWIYRIVRPSSGKASLLGQEADTKRGGIWSSPISILKNNGHEYLPETVLLKSNLANVLGVAVDDLEGNGTNSTIAFNSKDYLKVYNGTSRVSWESADKLGGNMSRFLIQPKDPTNEPKPQFFPMRVRSFDTDGDGKAEVITGANHDLTLNLVTGFRSFTKTHVQVLQWNSLGLQSVWQSQKLVGRISDLFVADYDNDGVVELVISLVTKDRGLLLSSRGESVIVAYDLMPVAN